jgi:mono/diheme cytochrome c family protein
LLTSGSAGGGGTFSGPPPVLEAPISAATPPPAISGGTLRVLADNRTAMAADPDRDRLFFADYRSSTLLAEVQLQAGDEPGRSVQDAAGRVHVVLRRGGAVVTVLPGGGQVAARRSVCAAPRGIAYDTATDLLHVACAEGTLVSLPAAPDGAVTRQLSLPRDLRDVVVQGNRLYVSRFRSAEVLVIDGDAVTAHLTAPSSDPAPALLTASAGSGGGTTTTTSALSAKMVPAVAWRMVADPLGDVLVLHQRAFDGPVTASVSTGTAYYGNSACGSIVQTTVTPMQTNPATPSVVGTTFNLAVGVDVAVSPRGDYLAIAAPGNARLTGTFNKQVIVVSRDQAGPTSSGCAVSTGQVPTPDDSSGPPQVVSSGLVTDPKGEVVAVAFDASGNLLAQTREPATIQVLTRNATMTVLSNESRLDTGHAVFHMNSSTGIACASCHPEGGDDGRVWKFRGKDGSISSLRTQNLRGGIMATAPFHWEGNLPTLDSLMTEVFVARMSGPALGSAYTGTLGKWLDGNPAMPAMPVQDAASVQRGSALFARSGCAECHAGTLLTDNRTQDVGTGMKVQTPSLRGAAWRAPYMHDGCAQTLSQRFDPACGGDKHGATSTFSQADVADLSAYIETL